MILDQDPIFRLAHFRFGTNRRDRLAWGVLLPNTVSVGTAKEERKETYHATIHLNPTKTNALRTGSLAHSGGWDTRRAVDIVGL